MSAENGAHSTLITIHTRLNVNSQPIARLFPQKILIPVVNRNGSTAIAIRAYGLRLSNGFPGAINTECAHVRHRGQVIFG